MTNDNYCRVFFFNYSSFKTLQSIFTQFEALTSGSVQFSRRQTHWLDGLAEPNAGFQPQDCDIITGLKVRGEFISLGLRLFRVNTICNILHRPLISRVNWIISNWLVQSFKQLTSASWLNCYSNTYHCYTATIVPVEFLMQDRPLDSSLPLIPLSQTSVIHTDRTARDFKVLVIAKTFSNWQISERTD